MTTEEFKHLCDLTLEAGVPWPRSTKGKRLMTPNQMIHIISAYTRFEEIEIFGEHDKQWHLLPTHGVQFNFQDNNYRIKPTARTAREWLLDAAPKEKPFDIVYICEITDAPDRAPPWKNHSSVIHVREVLPE